VGFPSGSGSPKRAGVANRCASRWRLVVAVALCLSPPAWSDTPPSGRGIITVTRYVKLFTDLEERMMDAVRTHDREAALKWLADDFEERTAAQPGRPVPRADWWETAHRSGAPDRIEGMAVHDMGEIAIASFLMIWNGAAGASAEPVQPQRPQSERPGQKRAYVVDVWKRAGGTWKLAIRYTSGA